MSALAVLARGRRAAESIMVDSCVIEHQTGESTNPDTGEVVPIYQTVYEGKCRIQSHNLQAGSPTSGQQRVDLYTPELHVPISVVGLQVSDRVTVTSTVDPDLNDRPFRIANLFHKTFDTARRVPLEEVTS